MPLHAVVLGAAVDERPVVETPVLPLLLLVDCPNLWLQGLSSHLLMNLQIWAQITMRSVSSVSSERFDLRPSEHLLHVLR